MLIDVLRNKDCFKLICGAGNANTDEVEKLVCIYSLAGCQLFDVCANQNVIAAAKNGLNRSGIEIDRYICISVGSESDRHFSKAEIISSLCTNCKNCIDICPQNAICIKNDLLVVDESKCIGCMKCFDKCSHNAVKSVHKNIDYLSFLPALIKSGIDCIEFHVFNDKQDALNKWNEINSMFDGVLSISINRSGFGDDDTVSLVESMINMRKPYTTIIQADGVPMSGGKDTYNSTLQAVATSDLFLSKKMPAFVIASGGTNSKTAELANLCDISLNGVAIGSYARKIVREYISRPDFWSNQSVFDESVHIAKQLVDSVKLCLK